MSYTNRYQRAGMARPVDPGIDVSHYGAPYQGMLGLGLGNETWSGSPPSADPRMLKQYSKAVLSYAVTNVPSGDAGPNALQAAARSAFPGQTVRKAWGNGWGSGGNNGRLGVEITFATATRLGEVKAKSNAMQGALTGAGLTGARLSQAKTHFNNGDLMTAEERAAHGGGVPVPPSDGLIPPVTGEPSGSTDFFTRRMAGLPVWGWMGLGVGAIAMVGVAVAVGGKGAPAPAAVTANRRRRARRPRGR